jgi:predicted nucleic acid-binding protein
MILADTSVWVGHLRQSDAVLEVLLEEGRIVAHPVVIGELACGNLKNRAEILDMLQSLPAAPVASDAEALRFIEIHRLMGRGVCYLDVQLLASAALAHGGRIWTHDARMRAAAARLFLAFDPHR